MRILRYLISGITLIAVAPALAFANNLTITNSSLVSPSVSNQTCAVQFDIRWENSWRNQINYDAAWVFVKYSTDAGTTWNHATLKYNGTNPAGFSNGTGTSVDIVVPPDKKGAFIQRNANSSGTLTVNATRLVWDWGADGLNANQTARVKVFGTEMVYVPSGTFTAGDGLSNASQFSATAITTAAASQPGGYPSGQTAPSSDSWPNGFNAFYLQKYEISQGAYRDFLNTLDRTYQNNRTAGISANQYVMSNTSGLSCRNGIRAPASIPGGAVTFGCDLNNNAVFNEAADGQWIAANYVSWADLAAYADWAGLRPMTELEFEKAARGPVSAVSGEYAWGSTNIINANTLANSGQASEAVLETGNGVCNYNSDGVSGPLRGGFAARSATTRPGSGASYWGVMELSGNLLEHPVTIGNSQGRLFTGLHGDGTLAGSGNADVTNWPDTSAIGAGFRGGAWFRGYTFERVSDRYLAVYSGLFRGDDYGARLSRTSP